jgi:hypothetical protein
MFLGFVRIAAVEMPIGTWAMIQVFDDDVVAFTSLTELLLASTTFPRLCNCRLGDAEAYHADGDCHTNECNSDAAQSLLLEAQKLGVRLHSSALVPLPWGKVWAAGYSGALARHKSERFAPAFRLR